AIQRYDFDGRKITESEGRALEGRFDALLDEINQVQKRTKVDRSLGTTIDELLRSTNDSGFDLRGIHYSINTEIEHEYAADVSRMSLKYWNQDESFPGGDILLPGGFDAII
ncbi:hypothetical protein, partial [Salmonella enterica]|uniref:hypothetical protein n=1 Tax=Salmonella enterica TaxID=28901 RepID=UPI003523B0D9